MDVAAEIRSQMGDEWLPCVYRDRVRSGRTRAVTLEVPQRENAATIEYTLLGIELKVGKRRFSCPDLATARYMRVFARIGCREFALPYDITAIPALADELETSWQRTLLLADGSSADKSERSASLARSGLIRDIRKELVEIGPGQMMPLFDRETRQRK